MKTIWKWTLHLTGLQGLEMPDARVHKMAPGSNRATDRARTYQVIAAAMAEQWGN